MSTNRDALFDLTGKIVVVTGAGGGLGTAICSGLAAYGADVALVDLDAASLEKAAASVAEHGRRAAAIEADASDEAAVGRAFAKVDEELGTLDILVNLPFVPISGPPHDLSLEDWNTAFRVNVTSYFLCCKEAARRMIAAGKGGAIMNMSSIGGTSAVGRGSFPYSVSKGGIVMMTKEMAVECARFGIRVNAIQPCQFMTPGRKAAVEARGRGDLLDTFLSGIPLGRLGEPHEMVGPVLFLVSDAASMVTGALLPVDGGNLAFNAGGTKD